MFNPRANRIDQDVLDNSITRVLRNAARENQSFFSRQATMINRIVTRDQRLQKLPDNLNRRLFSLKPGWQVLAFGARDWLILAQHQNVSGNAGDNLVDTALNYILANKIRVSHLNSVADRYSRFVLGDPSDLGVDLIGSVDPIDRQSLFFLKLNGSAFTGAHEGYVDYIRDRIHAPWVRQRLVGPLVHNAINSPHDSYLDTFLAYMVPLGDGGSIERQVVRHIIRDEASFDVSLELRSLIGMYCHPYDVLESFVNHFEIELARNQKLSCRSAEILLTLASEFPGSRASRLHSYLEWRHVVGGSGVPLLAGGNYPHEVTTLLEAFVEPDSSAPDIEKLPSEAWRALARMRWSKYPAPDDFESSTIFASHYRFLDAGRLFTALNTSMYMLSRRDALSESRELNRLHSAAGRTTPYIWAAPRGDILMNAQKQSDIKGWLGCDLAAGTVLKRRLDAEDRTWFHAVHWDLRKAERAVHVRNWLKVIRDHFPVRPRFLSGVDWSWIDRVLPQTRITPFRDNLDGPYALLLRDIEEQQRDSTHLRTAIEGVAAGGDCRDFVDKLIENYGTWATAFVRYFLTAETIMLLELAPNMTAALSDRITALEQCAAKFGFGELLDEEELRAEQQALTASLMLLRVNENQFDIPWATFVRDAGNRVSDQFATHEAMKRGDGTLALVTDSTFPYTHVFPNGRTADYVMSTRVINGGVVVLGVIDAFYDQPSYGIEVLLSTRFRHDTLRREFVAAFDDLADSNIPGVFRGEQAEIIEPLSAICLAHVDAWLQRHMQTIRPGVSQGFFDLTPTPDELLELATRVYNSEKMGDAIREVIPWIEEKLDEGLSRARASFSDDLWANIKDDFEAECLACQTSLGTDQSKFDIVSASVAATFQRKVESLTSWFARPATDDQSALTLAQVKQAVDGRFERDVREGRLVFKIGSDALADQLVEPEQVKMFFDLLTEIVRNALKYNKVDVTRVRVSRYERGGEWGALFSSQASRAAPHEELVAGHPFQSLSDSIFREGNSGLAKIAGLAASIFGDEIELIARRRKTAFHLFVPLGRLVQSGATPCPAS